MLDRYPKSELDRIRIDHGLSMSESEFGALAFRMRKQDPRVCSEELYMADTLLRMIREDASEKRIDRFSTDSPALSEAFSDLMDKRRALLDRGPVTLSSLVATYNRYLSDTGYDDGVYPGITLVPKKNTIPPADSLIRHSASAFKTAKVFPYAIAESDRLQKFNSDPERLSRSNTKGQMFNLILVRVPEFPLAYETLADVIENSPNLPTSVLYASPIADKGLYRNPITKTLSFNINFAELQELYPEIENPYLLAYPMSAALAIATQRNSPQVVEALHNAGFNSRVIGETARHAPGIFSVRYRGFDCILDTALISSIKSEELSFVNAKEEKGMLRKFESETMSVLSFTGADQPEIYGEVKGEISRLGDTKLSAFLVIPGNSLALARFLSVYRPLAESAIPIRKALFTSREDAEFSLALVSENSK